MRQMLLRIALPCAVLLCAAGPGLLGDEYNKRTDITINNPIEVPGAVLQPGTYTFKLVDYPSDRHIVEISSVDGKTVYAVIFTAAARRIERTGKPTMTFYEGGNGIPPAVREWFWPGELDGQTFLYPHDQATKIAQATGQKVNESPEGEPGPLVSKNQPPEQPAPAAEQTHPAPAPAPNVAEAAEPPAPAEAPREVAQATPPPAPQAEPNQAPPPANNNGNNTQLPQTASDIPLGLAVGLISIFAAASVRSLRRAAVKR